MNTTGRPIHLDLGMPSQSTFDSRTGGQAASDSRDSRQLASDSDRMQELLAAKGAEASGGTGKADIPRPFDLFSSRPPAVSNSAAAAGSENRWQSVDAALAHMAGRMLVGDGSSGRRAVQIELDDDNLPGVVMELFEEEGAVVVTFTCVQEASREKLAAAAAWLANSLAERLQRPACVRVQADDPEEPCLVEVRAEGVGSATSLQPGTSPDTQQASTGLPFLRR